MKAHPALTDEHEALRDTMRRFVAREITPHATRPPAKAAPTKTSGRWAKASASVAAAWASAGDCSVAQGAAGPLLLSDASISIPAGPR